MGIKFYYMYTSVLVEHQGSLALVASQALWSNFCTLHQPLTRICTSGVVMYAAYDSDCIHNAHLMAIFGKLAIMILIPRGWLRYFEKKN